MSAASGTALEAIVARTREHLAEEQKRRPLAQLLSAARQAPAARSLMPALSRPGRVNVIAEHKRRSPSRGVIREDLAAGEVARRYQDAGAAALSVLTESDFFGGSLAHLAEARASVSLPVLRKDFLLEPWQVWEARAAGADAVLLIVAALEDAALSELLAAVGETGMAALVEVHDRRELERALRAGARLVGVNNRDLRTLAVSLSTSLELVPLVPDAVVAVAESGIRSGGDLRRLREAGFDAFLVGESLMSAPCPGEALKELIREAEVAV